MMTRSILALALSVGAFNATGANYLQHSWKKIQLTDKFWSEGATFGDFNHDGIMDVVSGPYWWEGPDFKVRHEYYEATARKSAGGAAPFKLKNADGSEQTIEGFEGGLGKNNAYSDNFFAFSYDFNQDGWDDILILGFPGQDASWYENPHGKKNAEGTEHWIRHKVFDVVDNESPTFGDLTGDGKPEILCMSGGYVGYASPDWNDAAKPWTFHKISPKGNWQRFTHGIGYGDVNGDGKLDVLEKDGWWEQPKSLTDDPEWKFHKFPFAPTEGSSQMYVYDVNGDGLPDVVTALAAHNYGLAWYEQLRERDGQGEVQFKQHLIVGKTARDNKYGVVFSQPHAVDLVDMDGDGLKDIVTGKRFWAHGTHGDADPNSPAVLYWFKLVRGKDHSAEFVPYLIDDNSGIGTQVVAARASDKKYPDVVVGNKKGTFVFQHSAKKVSKKVWEAAQPKEVNEAGEKNSPIK